MLCRMRVHLLRHGQVENPENILYGRQPGWSLSALGKEMAQGVAEWSREIEIGALHVSPLQRAQETAAPISKLHQIAKAFRRR
jgi:broad specificity phosphatase PhoE